MSAQMIRDWSLLFGILIPSLAMAQTAARSLPPAVYSAPLAEPLPAPLAQALTSKVRFVDPGPIRRAAEQVVAGRAALANLRCSEVIVSLRKAGETLLEEVPLATAQPIARDLFGLLLLCGDRIGDVPPTALMDMLTSFVGRMPAARGRSRPVP